MTGNPSTSKFSAELRRPAKAGDSGSWAFVVLPKSASDNLPRRGRTTIDGTLNGHAFRATLEPDGQLSHWMTVPESLYETADAKVGDVVDFEIMPVEQEPEPEVPVDFQEALEASPEAREVWTSTTVIARLDWIHWITSAKQAKTRAKRIEDACDMLTSGKKRVCCFDPSGYYSKALRAPETAD